MGASKTPKHVTVMAETEEAERGPPTFYWYHLTLSH